MINFWKGKRVLITGHTGFKGSWLALWLQSLEATVIGYSLDPPTAPNLYSLAEIANGMVNIHGDIRNFDFLKNAINTHHPEIIFHMAAQPLVRSSYNDPIETFSTNAMGTVNLLEAVRQTKSAKAIINVTTDKCYENKEWQWGYRENDRLGGHDPYSSSKACSELITSSFRNSYFNHDPRVGIASARAGNVIGGGDWASDRLIPDIIYGCMAKRLVNIRYPHALRPWQHVLEPLNGYLLLAQRLYESSTQFSESWNFGPNEDDIKPVGWIADRIIKLWKEDVSWNIDKNEHPHEASLLKLDCSKAKSILGWHPRWNLEKALQETVSWYQAYQAKENMRDITLSQISKFSNLPLCITN